MAAQSFIEERTTRELGCYGRLHIIGIADRESGSVLYRLHAPHVRGCVALTPAAAEDDPTARTTVNARDLITAPEVVALPFVLLDARPLTINNIALTEPVRIRSDDPETIHGKRRGKTGSHEPLPARTRLHAKAVLTAVVDHWRQRQDLPELQDAARRRAALLSRSSDQLAKRQEVLRNAQAAMDDTNRRISKLHALLNDNTAAATS